MASYDAHVHLDFMSNAKEVAHEAAERGLDLFANTVTPEGFVYVRQLVGELANVRVGLGLHPWWIDRADVQDFLELLSQTSWVGEVGLDFSPKRAHHYRQLDTFEQIATACAHAGSKTLSIHSVRAVTPTLDVLEETGCLSTCTCILHWFSGSTDELWRAIRLGCWFSINERQARTRRAKEQLKLIPEDKILFETDLPADEGVPCSVEEIMASLVRAEDLTEGIRHTRA